MDKFDTKINQMSKKYKIGTAELKEYLDQNKDQIDPFKYVDQDSFHTAKESKWVNRFCKNNGIKINIQLLKDEKRMNLANYVKENEINFLNINGKIAKMD